MKRAAFLFLLLFFFACNVNLQAQNPFIHNYTSFDGLPSNTIYQVYQDSKKFIWFVTDAGVSRFDGSNFINFSKQDGLTCNDVVHIKEDSMGRIWFFNMDATLNYYRDGVIYNGNNAPFLDSLSSREFFRDFYEDTDHTIYFYYNYQREIFALDSGNRVTKYKLNSIMVGDKINNRLVEGMVIKYVKKIDGWFYLWTIAGLCRLKDFSQIPELVPGTPAYKAVFSSRERPEFIVTKVKENGKYEIYKLQDDLNIDLSKAPISINSEFISAVMQDEDGFVWVSTFDEGVYCYLETEIFRHFDIKEAQAIIQDHERNIWITSLKEGAYLITPFLNKHVHYEKSYFDEDGILALAHHKQNGVWMTNGNFIYLLQDDIIKKLDFLHHENYLDQLMQVDDNTLVVGELSTSYYAIEGIHTDYASNRILYNGYRISPTPLKRLTMNRSGDKIATWNFFAIVQMKPRLFDNFNSYYLGERVFNTFYNADDELIVNAKKNFIILNDRLFPSEKMAKFNGRIISDHLVIEDSADVFNIEGDSLFISVNDKFYNLTEAWNYPFDLQIKYLEYRSPTLFIGTSRNIFYCNHPLNIMTGDTVDLQMMNISFRNIHNILFDQGRLYVASDDGLTAISGNSYGNVYTGPPIPYFQSIQVNDLPVRNDHPEVVLTGRKKILMDFSNINYSFNPIIYSYKLEGLDKDWQKGRSSNVVYENLPKGDYIFKLRARKPTSGWSEPIEYRIRINAPLWQQPVFFVLLSIVLAGILLIIILLRKNAEIKRREIEHQLVVLEQRALQSMMNPHFIFNSLGSIQHYLLQSKPAEAGMYLSQFARLIRQNLNSINAAMINLDEELDRLNNYLDLEKMRMEKEFEYKIEVEDAISSEDVLIPSMIIQPFVENSIWHGISQIDGRGKILIAFRWNDEKSLKIIVEDNGIGMKPSEMLAVNSEKHLKIGMSLTLKRLDLLGKKYAAKTGIHIQETFPGNQPPGTHIEILVPYIIGTQNKGKLKK